MSKPASSQAFRDAIEDVRRRNPLCCYCKRDLTTVPTKKLILIDRNPQRLACRNCPDMIEIEVEIQ